MKFRMYALGGFLGVMLALGPVAMAQGSTSGVAAGGNAKPQTGAGAGGAAGVTGPRGSENGPTPHPSGSSMGSSGGKSGMAAGHNAKPQTGSSAGGAAGVTGPRGSENGPTPK